MACKDARPTPKKSYPLAMQLRGCGTALVTPFSQDGAVDENALRNLISWQVESGIDFLVPCGTTGETPTLTHDEWLRVIDMTIEVVAGRAPIVAGATSNSTQEAVAKAKQVATRSGVHAILTASPYYNKPTQEGQYRHFRAIAEAIDKPIILYNVPSRTSANLEPATVARLSEVPNIVGIKEASGNMTQVAEVINTVPETFLVLSGDDAVTLPVIALGGVGVISVASNEIPREMSEMTRAALNNDWQTARALQHKYLPLMQANFVESSPLPVKAVLAMMGKIEEVYRLPLLPMRRDTRSKLQKIATDAGLISRPAAPPVAASEFYVYENWAAGPHKAVLHRASCGQCSSGKGRPSGHDPKHSKWHGPYGNLVAAREASHQMPGVLIRSECKCVA
jgi:4-hydroxy-tetrahydrodipicolinate synthase